MQAAFKAAGRGKNMKISELRNMTDSELKELAKQKRITKKGKCGPTSDAYQAQNVLWIRAGRPFSRKEQPNDDPWELIDGE